MIHFRWKDWGPDKVTAEDDCAVLEAKRPARLVFREHPDSGSPPTTVEIHFIPQSDATVVRLREYGFQNTPRGGRALVAQAGVGRSPGTSQVLRGAPSPLLVLQPASAA